MVMSEAELERIKRNIFVSAQSAITDWEKFPWHRNKKEIDTYQKNSSQALAIDLFGTLSTSVDRDTILNNLASKLNLPASDTWEINLEWTDEKNLLKEHRKSQIDAVAFGKKTVIFFECKFTENDSGKCSQPDRNDCNGNYELQINPNSSKHTFSYCSLTGKKIRYWKIIPTLFKYDVDVVNRPCPFKGSWYQWMRNIVLCHVIAKQRFADPKFLILYADAKGLSMAEKIKNGYFQSFLSKLKDPKIVQFLTYQDLTKLALDSSCADKDKFIQLESWISNKIQSQVKFPNARY
jgi:hypothetical protein